jgi:phosphatidate cytidylyltransferase
MLFWWLLAPAWLVLKLRVRQRLILAVTGLGVLLPAWLALARLQADAGALLALLGVVWVADTAAYVVGRAAGRIKLAPTISPGKTWEGACGAVVAVVAYAFVAHRAVLDGRTLRDTITIFVGMTVVSIVGDLFESWMKRGADVKDSGSIFPGHGGMLDRIDSITAALPMAALIFGTMRP